MLVSKFYLKFNIISLLNQSSIVIALLVVSVVFGILLLLGIRKSQKLKKENERLEAMNTKIDDDKEKPYKDFTDGHMYGDN